MKLRAGQEAFFVRAGVRLAFLPLTWRTAYLHPGRVKTILALTRARSRKTMSNYAFLFRMG